MSVRRVVEDEVWTSRKARVILVCCKDNCKLSNDEAVTLNHIRKKGERNRKGEWLELTACPFWTSRKSLKISVSNLLSKLEGFVTSLSKCFLTANDGVFESSNINVVSLNIISIYW